VQEGIWILDSDLRTTYVNTCMANMLGSTVEAMYQKPFVDFLFADDGKVASYISNLNTSNEPLDCRFQQADGSARWTRVSSTQLKDESGKLIGYVTMHIDLTYQKKTEDALQTSRENMGLMIDSVKDYAIMIVDSDRHILTWNSGAKAIFGYNEEEMIGQLTDLLFTEIDVEHKVPVLEIDTATKTGHSYDDRWHVRKDGSTFYASGVMTRLSQDGESTKFIKICRDWTERKHMEDVMKRADRHKNEFLATLAHELRNPLASILSGMEVLSQEQDYTKTKSTREAIERQVQQMIHLVNDLLDISRISLGKIKITKKPVNVIDAFHFAIETARPIIDGYKHTLDVSLPAGPIIVNGDITRLSQVFLNILINSAKYTPPEGKIVLAASCDNGELVTRIRDNGIGIPPKMLASIFEMFEQVQDRSEYPQAGLGIGLSVVKELVEMHEGHVVAHSEGVNKGSEFIVKLPVLHNQEAAADQKSDGPPQRDPVVDETTSSKKKILLVDDNTDAADMMELLLKKKGYEIRKAYNGETAIVSAMEFNPEIVLLDLGLPDISGYDVLRTLQEKPGKRAYIALSGWGQEEDLSRSKQAGFDHHLVKPIDIHSLTEILASVR
jgi:PAS domain S-box-containing protein